MLKKILKEATRIEQWQQEIYTALHNIDAAWVTTGTFDVARIPGLDASKIISGTFDVARIPNLDASKITSGRFPLARLPTSATANRFLVVRTANADPVYDVIVAGDIPGLDASKIVSGTFDVARIPNLDASKITSGRFPVSRLPDGTSGYVLVGQGSGYDMAWRDISGIAGTITDSQHGTKTGIPFAHHGDWGHYGKIPTSAPTGALERAYVDSANLYVHDGTSWILRATKDWNRLINKPSTFPPSTHASSHASGGADAVSLDASQITSGRLNLSRIPTSATANRFLAVRTANADPVYDVLVASDIPSHASSHEYGGADLVRNLDYLAIRGTKTIDESQQWIAGRIRRDTGCEIFRCQNDTGQAFTFALCNAANTGPIDHYFVPDTANFGYIGTLTNYWYYFIGFYVWGAWVSPKDGDNTGYLGGSARRWAYLYAVNKSAAFKHPLHNPERYIVFKCVESPKVTVEDWGIAELKGGKAFVSLSEEFIALMSDKAEYAVFLTPEGECNGLYVSKKEFYGFEVRELNNGKSNIHFSWQVKAVRIGDEETPVLEEPTPQFADQEKDKQLEWTKNRQEANKKKEGDRLNRMKQKIAKYREAKLMCN